MTASRNPAAAMARRRGGASEDPAEGTASLFYTRPGRSSPVVPYARTLATLFLAACVSHVSAQAPQGMIGPFWAATPKCLAGSGQ